MDLLDCREEGRCQRERGEELWLVTIVRFHVPRMLAALHWSRRRAVLADLELSQVTGPKWPLFNR